MELPLTPYFFKKLDVYQQLKDLDAAGKKIWEAEKALLQWAAGPHHQHIGSYLNTGHVRDGLESTGNIGLVGGDLEDFLRQESQKVLDALELDGFGDRHPDYPKNKDVRINTRGLLAGRILRETNLLRDCRKYEGWIRNWWVLFWVGIILIISQAALTLLNLILKLIDIARANVC